MNNEDAVCKLINLTHEGQQHTTFKEGLESLQIGEEVNDEGIEFFLHMTLYNQHILGQKTFLI